MPKLSKSIQIILSNAFNLIDNRVLTIPISKNKIKLEQGKGARAMLFRFFLTWQIHLNINIGDRIKANENHIITWIKSKSLTFTTYAPKNTHDHQQITQIKTVKKLNTLPIIKGCWNGFRLEDYRRPSENC